MAGGVSRGAKWWEKGVIVFFGLLLVFAGAEAYIYFSNLMTDPVNGLISVEAPYRGCRDFVAAELAGVTRQNASTWINEFPWTSGPSYDGTVRALSGDIDDFNRYIAKLDYQIREYTIYADIGVGVAAIGAVLFIAGFFVGVRLKKGGAVMLLGLLLIATGACAWVYCNDLAAISSMDAASEHANRDRATTALAEQNAIATNVSTGMSIGPLTSGAIGIMLDNGTTVIMNQTQYLRYYIDLCNTDIPKLDHQTQAYATYASAAAGVAVIGAILFTVGLLVVVRRKKLPEVSQS